MIGHPDPPTLALVLAPHGDVDEIFAVLTDYSAAGLIDPFIWVSSGDIGGASVPATLVASGRSSAVVLQQVLTGRRHHRLRLAVLVPVDESEGRPAARAAEQTLEQIVRASAVGTPITLLRLLFNHSAALDTNYDPTLVLEGWHNLLVAPEDSAGPGLGSMALDRLTDPFDVARYVAPVVAAAAGLWSGIDRVVFDDLAILPGSTLRTVRSFYRQLDATGVEDQLRLELFDSGGRLPLPRGGPIPVGYASDDALATRTVARALWTKHRDVLRGRRVEIGKPKPQAISVRAALKIFFSFLWAALRNAPSVWLSSLVGSMSSALATTVQHTVFGRSDSAFAVVAGDKLTNWQEIARSADEMSTVLEAERGIRQLAATDLTPLWVDYINGALTLADGGRRSSGIDPITVGAGVGVVHNSADVVPSAADAFTAIPASLAAVIGVPQVTAGDVIGIADLRSRLERTFNDGAAGIEARQASAKLMSWETAGERSYASQVSSILADFLGRARDEVSDLVQRIRDTAERAPVDGKLRRRQQVIAAITRTAGWTVFVAVFVLLSIAATGWVTTSFALLVGGIGVAVYLVAALALFALGQRDLFATLNLQESRLAELEAIDFNLRAALEDVRRLSLAYGQLLAWNRVLGEVLRAPFGPIEPIQTGRFCIQDGLPRAMQIRVADPVGNDVEATARALRQQIYTTGWLTGPWERMLESAERALRDEPSALFQMPGVGSGSALDDWSHAVARGVVRVEGANPLWTQVQAMLDDPNSGIATALTATAFSPAGEQRPSLGRLDGDDSHRRTAHPAPFDASLFTDTAVTAGNSIVAIDDTAVDRRGLSYTEVVVQVGKGLPAYDFAMFAPTVRPVVTDDDAPPQSGVLVF